MARTMAVQSVKFLSKNKRFESVLFRDEIPNAETRQAIEDSINGVNLHKFNTIEEMFAELEREFIA